MVAVVDCGHVVNPRTVEMQIESGVIYGLTAALYGEITIRDGRVEQGNFDDYPMVRMADAPRIETHLALSGGKQMGRHRRARHAADRAGLCNAIFAATGKRIRSPADQKHQARSLASLPPILTTPVALLD